MICSAGFQPAEAASLVFWNHDLKVTPPGELSCSNVPARPVAPLTWRESSSTINAISTITARTLGWMETFQWAPGRLPPSICPVFSGCAIVAAYLNDLLPLELVIRHGLGEELAAFWFAAKHIAADAEPGSQESAFADLETAGLGRDTTPV